MRGLGDAGEWLEGGAAVARLAALVIDAAVLLTPTIASGAGAAVLYME